MSAPPRSVLSLALALCLGVILAGNLIVIQTARSSRTGEKVSPAAEARGRPHAEDEASAKPPVPPAQRDRQEAARAAFIRSQAEQETTRQASQRATERAAQQAALLAAEVAAGKATGHEPALGAEALARIGYPIDRLDFEIVFLGGRDDLLGAAWSDRRRIEIYVRPDHSVDDVASILGHEIGHAVDYTHITTERRGQYLAARGLDAATPWNTCDLCPDYATGSGDFAEAFSAWLVGPDRWRGQLGPVPSRGELRALEPFFRN